MSRFERTWEENDYKIIYLWAFPLIQGVKVESVFLKHFRSVDLASERSGWSSGFIMCLIPCHQLNLAMMPDLGEEVIHQPDSSHLNFPLNKQFRWFSDSAAETDDI